jgi:hypothetical protein
MVRNFCLLDIQWSHSMLKFPRKEGADWNFQTLPYTINLRFITALGAGVRESYQQHIVQALSVTQLRENLRQLVLNCIHYTTVVYNQPEVHHSVGGQGKGVIPTTYSSTNPNSHEEDAARAAAVGKVRVM